MRRLVVFVVGLIAGLVALSACTTLEVADDIAQVGVGFNSTCVLKTDGSVACAGVMGSSNPIDWGTSLTAVFGISGAQDLAFGSGHACVIMNDSVRCFGDRTGGALGDGGAAFGSTVVPVVVAGLPVGDSPVQVTAGGRSSCVRLESGSLYCWGFNNSGQLGVGDTTTRLSATPVVGYSAPTDPAVIDVDIAQGVMCLRTATTVACTGSDFRGQQGDGPAETPSMVPTSVPSLVGIDLAEMAVGSVNVCVVTTSLAAQCWGENPWNMFATSELFETAPVPLDFGDFVLDIEIAGTTVCAVLDGLYAKCVGTPVLGDGSMSGSGTPVVVSGSLGNSPIMIDGGSNHACMVTTINEAWCWGDNDDGELSTGSTTDQLVPVQMLEAP